jgi:hypothetical protein
MRIKGSLTRDFQLQVLFFTKISLPHAPALPIGAISNCLRKICGDLRKQILITKSWTVIFFLKKLLEVRFCDGTRKIHLIDELGGKQKRKGKKIFKKCESTMPQIE